MAIFSSPLLLGAIILAALVALRSYRLNVDTRRRYALLGAGPPERVSTNTLGQYSNSYDSRDD